MRAAKRAPAGTGKEGWAYLAAVGNAVIVGFSFLFVKIALETAHPLDTLSHRFTASFAVLVFAAAAGWIRVKIRPREMIALLPLALLYPSLFFAFQAFGLAYSSSSEAGIIHATVPIFTALLAAVVLKEYTGIRQVLFILLSAAGVVYIFVMKGAAVGSGAVLGTVLILLSAGCLAAYSVMARRMAKRFTVMEMTFAMTLIGFVFFGVMSAGRHAMEGTLPAYFEPLGSLPFLAAVLYLGVLSSMVTSMLNTYALSKLEASKVSVFSHLSTLVTIAAGALILKEELHYYHFVGAALILLGVVGTNLPGRRRK
ncbi:MULTISPECIES: DMT family transporter [Paenibacillus]|uniref:DMT family transporter n=1 Tax=Paenibacillus TaxID=44249 RepID=UPI0022B91240|nr:DMT family transporter [Paenibacillus caseinilyticus]MCZ8520856.1 DMT family transporter [Paenibacillus caseinilyticus]